MELYPFQTGCSVWLVSFPAYDLASVMEEDKPMPLPPFAKGKVDTARFIAYKKLSHSGVDSLTELFYCYGTSKYENVTGCRETSKAILFVDNKGMIYSFIFFCFDEGSFQSSSNSFGIGGWCGTKIDLIHRFFLQGGIRD